MFVCVSVSHLTNEWASHTYTRKVMCDAANFKTYERNPFQEQYREGRLYNFQVAMENILLITISIFFYDCMY